MNISIFYQRHIFKDNLESNPVKEVFSVDAKERLDQKDLVSIDPFYVIFCLLIVVIYFSSLLFFFWQILFATFDPPDLPIQGVVGHFCVVGINMLTKRFQLLDSLRGPADSDAQRVLHKMANNIKKLWREAVNSKGETFHPNNIDDFGFDYVKVPKQLTA